MRTTHTTKSALDADQGTEGSETAISTTEKESPVTIPTSKAVRPSVTLGRTVKSAIALSGMTVAETGRMIDLSASSMSRRTSGRVPFKCDELVRIAIVLEVSIRDLLADWEAEMGRAV